MRLSPGATFGPGIHISANLPTGLECGVCKEKFDPAAHNQKICGKYNCKLERGRIASTATRQRNKKAKAAGKTTFGDRMFGR